MSGEARVESAESIASVGSIASTESVAPAESAASVRSAASPSASAASSPGSAGVPPAEPGPPASGRLSAEPRRIRPSPWPRLAVIAAMLLPAAGLVTFGRTPAALWTAGLWGSVVCCGGTDSGWRWLNRALVACAIAWLLVPLVFAT